MRRPPLWYLATLPVLSALAVYSLWTREWLGVAIAFFIFTVQTDVVYTRSDR